MTLPRRRLLRAASTTPFVALAGCSFLPERTSQTTESPDYEQLRNTAVYVGDDVGLRLPESVPRVSAPTNADLLVVHGNPEVSVETAVSWLADDRAVALLGDRAQDTWLDWARSEEFEDTFDTQGVGEAEPAPQLLVGATVGVRVTTYRKTWENQPNNDEIVAALDETMSDLETQRSEEEES
ncbi:hypothetical protein [Natronomonas sp.]|uniref:hypothetical protein n=1 Tax=Natronomonas sp. TaxID=2184060 RepID=UPI002FC29195